MLIEKKIKVDFRGCHNRHPDWFRGKYCTTCGGRVHKTKVDRTVKACDQCGKEMGLVSIHTACFSGIFSVGLHVLFCTHFVSVTGEHMKPDS